MPRMSWLQVIAWLLNFGIVGGLWLRGQVRSRPTGRVAAPETPRSADAATPAGAAASVRIIADSSPTRTSQGEA